MLATDPARFTQSSLSFTLAKFTSILLYLTCWSYKRCFTRLPWTKTDLCPFIHCRDQGQGPRNERNQDHESPVDVPRLDGRIQDV